MAVNILNTSTLSEAITADQGEFAVASTANVTVGQLLVIRSEAVKVVEIPVSGRVKVRRGFAGTAARAHANSTRFFIGDGDDFKAIRDSFTALVGDSGTLPDYCLPGTRGRDGAGNEYVMVELTETVVPGATVLISKDGNFTAAVLTSAGYGPVGVMAENASSDQYAWAQVAGFCRAKLGSGSSLATSTGVLQPASSVSTPAVGLIALTTSQASSNESALIYGMWPASAATTASTSASSETGLAINVFMQYPFVRRIVTS